MTVENYRTVALRNPVFALSGCTVGFLGAFVASMSGFSPLSSFFLALLFPSGLAVVTGVRRALQWSERMDLFSPTVAFPLLYVAWFGVASFDFVDVPSSISFGLFEPIPAHVLVYATLGLIAYLTGAFLWRTRTVGMRQIHPEFNWIESRFWVVIAGLTLLMIISFVYIVAGMGAIPALVADAGELRLKMRNYGPEEAVMFTAAWSLIPMLMMYIWLCRPHGRRKVLCYVIVTLASILLVSLGARSYLFVPMLVTIVARHYGRAQFKFGRLLLFSMVIFCALSLFGYLRDSSLTGTSSIADQVGIPKEIMPLAYAYLYVRYPVATFRDITRVIPGKVPFQLGAQTFGPLATLLPGHHEQSDMFFKDILGNDFIGAGQPATLLGPLYADAGIGGIVAGLFLFARLISRIYEWMQKRPTVIRVLIYGWVVQTLLFSLFSNLFPYITTIWIPAFWGFLHFLLQKRNDEGNMQPLRYEHAN